METEERDLKEQIDVIVGEATNMTFKDSTTQDDIRDYIKKCFETDNLQATIENDEDGFVIVYGIYSKTIWYLTGELKDLKEDGAVIGSTDDWNYKVDPATQKAVLTEYKASTLGDSIVIPNIIDGYLISGLGDQVFMLRTSLREVYFSEGLRTIGDKAFSNCYNLTTVGSFPSSLISIGEEAFYNCSSLTTEIVLTDRIKSIGSSAFYNCSNITGTVENVLKTNVSYGTNVFYGCSKIKGDIAVALDALITDEDTKISSNLFSGMSGLTGTIVITSNIRTIGDNTFSGCTNIQGLDLTNATSLVNIGKGAFYNCTSMVGEIKFYSEISFIGESAFENCKKITYVEFPSTLTLVNGFAFRNCTSLKKIVFNCGNVFADYSGWNWMFYNCTGLKEIEFGINCSMTKIASRCFVNCTGLKTVAFPESIVTIDTYAFSQCTNLQTVSYPTKLKKIGEGAFYNCTSLLTLPYVDETKKDKFMDTLTQIGTNAFFKCTNLGKITDNLGNESKTDLIKVLQNSKVTSIGDEAFRACKFIKGAYGEALRNVASVKITIGLKAFDATDIVKAQKFELQDSTNTVIANSEFMGVSAFTDDSDNVITEIEIPYGVTTIGSYAFADCTSITKLIIPSTVTKIGSYAFSGCSSLKEVVYDASYYELPEYIFSNCTSLTTISNMDKITKINSNAFMACTSLSNFDFGENLTICAAAFQSSGLTSITLSATTKISGANIFASCNSLEKVDFSKCTFTTLYDSIFYSCDKLTNVTLNSNLKVIEQYCFWDCDSLTSIYIPESVTTLGRKCFFDSGLQYIYGCKGVTTLSGSEIFANSKNLETVERSKFSYRSSSKYI
jgi:hypothetical protein